MSLQINEVAPDFDGTDFEGVRPHLLDLVQGTTACSSTVFYGLLAWANLHAHKPLCVTAPPATANQKVSRTRQQPGNAHQPNA